jgi:hypothetical protein
MLLFVTSKSTVVAAAALIALSWGAAAGLASADPPAPPPGPAPGPPPGAPAPEAKTTIDHDGTYAVGTDIVPGTYTSAGPVGSGTCYWKRVGSGDDGKQPWQKNDAAVPDPGKTPAEAGIPLNILGGLLGGGAPPPPPPPKP